MFVVTVWSVVETIVAVAVIIGRSLGAVGMLRVEIL